MTNAQKEFFDWLQANDKFVYDVMVQKLASQGQSLSGWGDIFQSVGKGLVAVAPAYMAYKGSRDAQKLQKAQFEYQKQQATKPPPTPNIKAVDEIKRRWALALKGQSQPPSVGYKPFVNPNALTNYREAVSKTAKSGWSMVALPLGVAASLFLGWRFFVK